MGFLGDLGKGFIRSAVNQVGRDTGKVVSNKIYGDAHATPIRGVRISEGIYIDDNTSEPISENDFIERLRKERYNISYFCSNPLLKCFNWSFGLLVTTIIISCGGGYWALIPCLLLIFVAILKVLAAFKIMSIYQNKEMATYKSDRRYSSGRRYVGHSVQKVEFQIKPTKSYKVKTIIIAFVYTLLAIYMYLSSLNISKSFETEGWNIFVPIIAATITILILHLIINLQQRQ